MPVVQAAHQSATEQMRVPEDYVTRRDYETMVRERDYHQAMEQGLFEDNERLGKQAEQMKPLVEACGKLTWEFATDGNYCKPMALVEHSKLVAIAQALSLATIEQREKR